MTCFTIMTVMDGDCSRKEVDVNDGKGAAKLALERLRDRLGQNREPTLASALIGEGTSDPDGVRWIGAWLWQAGEGFSWSQDDDIADRLD